MSSTNATTGKVALEEHVTTAENNELWDSAGEADRNGQAYMDDVESKLPDVDRRVELMDRNGIDYSILSLTAPGVQGIADPALAVDFARRTNDLVRRRFVDEYPTRLGFFAAVALQNPEAAAVELRRAVRDLGAAGALVNGYTDVAGPTGAVYLDAPENRPFWDAVAELDVPVYLHPREPRPAAQAIYRGYESLVGSAWGFGHETGTHAVRLMLSGLFDTHPGVQIILGHLGEGLPYLLPRLEHRLDRQREGVGLGKARRRVTEYFNENFLVTTSGHFDSLALGYAIETIGADRVLFSVDYPYETMEDAAQWFDTAPLNHNDARKIGHENAARIFRWTEPSRQLSVTR